MQWQSNAKTSNSNGKQLPTRITADWAQDIVRPKSTASDIAVRPGSSLVFEDGTPADASLPSSGGHHLQLKLHNGMQLSFC